MSAVDELRVVRDNGFVNNIALVGAVVVLVGLRGLSGAWGRQDRGVWWGIFGALSWVFGAAVLLALWSQAKQLWDGKPGFVFRPDGFAAGSPGSKPVVCAPWEQTAAISAVTDATYRVSGSCPSAAFAHKLLLARQPGLRTGRAAAGRFDCPRGAVPGFGEVARYVAAAAPHVAVPDERPYGVAEQCLRGWGLRT